MRATIPRHTFMTCELMWLSGLPQTSLAVCHMSARLVCGAAAWNCTSLMNGSQGMLSQDIGVHITKNGFGVLIDEQPGDGCSADVDDLRRTIDVLTQLHKAQDKAQANKVGVWATRDTSDRLPQGQLARDVAALSEKMAAYRKQLPSAIWKRLTT